MPPMRYPDSTKKRSTPPQPNWVRNPSAFAPAPVVSTRPKWKIMTSSAASPRMPSRAGTWRRSLAGDGAALLAALIWTQAGREEGEHLLGHRRVQAAGDELRRHAVEAILACETHGGV